MADNKENVIVLDDDDENLRLPDDDCDVIDLVNKEMLGNSKCINYSCKSGSNMLIASDLCLSYYRVKQHKKNCFVCGQCYQYAIKFYDKVVNSVVIGETVTNTEVPFRNDLVEVDDSDEEAAVITNEALSITDLKLIDNHMDNIINKLVVDYKVDKKIEIIQTKIDEDVEKFKGYYEKMLEEAKQLHKDMDNMHVTLYNDFNYKYESLPAIEIIDYPGWQEEEDIKINEEVIFITPPDNLPLDGIFIKPQLKPGEMYYAANNNNVGCIWIKVILQKITDKKLYEVMPVHKKSKNKDMTRTLSGKDLAYTSPAPIKLPVGSRIIAVYPNSTNHKRFYAGIAAESPSALNNYRYLIFFDDGYAHYVHFNLVYPIVETSKDVWDDINGESKVFIKKYLMNYPDRPMVKFKRQQKVSTEYNGTWHTTTVLSIDCSLVEVSFDASNRKEWIYRGSTRLKPMFKEELAATNRLLNNKRIPRSNTTTSNNSMPYVQYTNEESQKQSLIQQPLKAVARKSTAKPSATTMRNEMSRDTDFTKSKIVYYTPKRQKPETEAYKQHQCSSKCRNKITYNPRSLVSYNPLAKPLLCGFHRLLYKFKNKKYVVYKTPCSRHVRNIKELHYYLRITTSMLTVDLFNFDVNVRCLAEFFLDDDISPLKKDLSGGQEEVPITVVNYIDNELLDFCNYSTRREPMEGVNLNLHPDFLCGCDCKDDCSDKSKCSCWQLTLGGMKYLQVNDPEKVGYTYRRLMEPVHTGIYECNVRCKCSATCLNRVVQNPLQHKLQVFKTVNRGWGIRCINDIPKGAFICIYAGALLTEQMANEGGQCYGDEYFAELDYIEVVEKMKEDYEAEVIESENRMYGTPEAEYSEQNSDDEEDESSKKESEYEYDREFVPSGKHKIINEASQGPKPKLRKREKEDASSTDTVTISDDEEDVFREPSSFDPKTNIKLEEDERSSSIRSLFGKDEDVYIMDAKSTGNIGRFLNHSCSPNIFVQNVFVDTHDLRFPWVAFFAVSYIKAGTELTWNYQYDVGSVPGKILVCKCMSTECKGRLL